jgi:hypothetical protein
MGIGLSFKANIPVGAFKVFVNDYFCQKFGKVQEKEKKPKQLQLLLQVYAFVMH